MTDIQLPYVQAFRDRHGLMRYYVRKRGLKRVALPGLPSSKPFMDAYHAALGSGPAPGTPKGGPRSLSALIKSYYASPKFKNLEESSRETYRQALKPIEERDGHRSAVDLPEDKARKIIEEIGVDRPGAANTTRAVLRNVFKHAVSLKWRHGNPFAGIEAYKLGSFHCWTGKEIAAFIARWPVGTRERTAFDLHYYTAQRISDVVKMRRDDITGDTLYVKH
jgi:site-specific recombinase XerD